MKKAFAVSVFVGLFASGCASFEGWNQVETKNITLYTNTDSQYKETLRQLENTYASLSVSFFKGKDIGKVEVLFMDDTDFIEYFGNFRKGAALASVPGDGTIGKNGLLVLRPHSQPTNPSVGADGVSASTFAAGTGSLNNAAGTSAKEMLTHLFIQRAMPKVPLWFHEGFSAYVSTSEVRGGNGQTFGCFGFPLTGEVMMPVASLWDTTFEQYGKPEYRGWFQATAMTLVDFVMHADNNKHRSAMGQMVNDLAAGMPSSSVVAAAFDGANEKAIDELLQVHRQNVSQIVVSAAPVRGQCPFGVVIPKELAPDESPPKITARSAADIEGLFRALSSFPAKDEYPPYYPPEVVAKVKVRAKS